MRRHRRGRQPARPAGETAGADWLAGGGRDPIEHHSMLSDQRTAAIVTPDARITWLCVPRIDSAAVFAELVGGPVAGYFSVRPTGHDAATGQRYVDDSHGAGDVVADAHGHRLPRLLGRAPRAPRRPQRPHPGRRRHRGRPGWSSPRASTSAGCPPAWRCAPTASRSSAPPTSRSSGRPGSSGRSSRTASTRRARAEVDAGRRAARARAALRHRQPAPPTSQAEAERRDAHRAASGATGPSASTTPAIEPDAGPRAAR